MTFGAALPVVRPVRSSPGPAALAVRVRRSSLRGRGSVREGPVPRGPSGAPRPRGREPLVERRGARRVRALSRADAPGSRRRRQGARMAASRPRPLEDARPGSLRLRRPPAPLGGPRVEPRPLSPRAEREVTEALKEPSPERRTGKTANAEAGSSIPESFPPSRLPRALAAPSHGAASTALARATARRSSTMPMTARVPRARSGAMSV